MKIKSEVLEVTIGILILAFLITGICCAVQNGHRRSDEYNKADYSAYVKLTGNPKELTPEEYRMVKNHINFNISQ